MHSRLQAFFLDQVDVGVIQKKATAFLQNKLQLDWPLCDTNVDASREGNVIGQ